MNMKKGDSTKNDEKMDNKFYVFFYVNDNLKKMIQQEKVDPSIFQFSTCLCAKLQPCQVMWSGGWRSSRMRN